MKWLSMFLLLFLCALSDVAQGSSPPDSDYPAQSRVADLGFVLIVAPNLKYSSGVTAIIGSENFTKSRGRQWATLTHQRMSKGKKFHTLQILVFKTEAPAKAFGRYQIKRKGKPLTESDYRNLIHIWKHVPLCGVFTGQKSNFYSPQTKPGSWWQAILKSSKVKTKNLKPKTQKS